MTYEQGSLEFEEAEALAERQRHEYEEAESMAVDGFVASSPGSVAQRVMAGPDAREERREHRYRMLRGLWALSSLKRLRACRKAPVGTDGVAIVLNDEGGAHYRGVETCGSVHSCPVCAAKVRAKRADEIEKAVTAWLANSDHSAVFATFTIPHHIGDRLADSDSLVREAWTKVWRSRRGRSIRERYGVEHYIRAIEHTHGANGWHPHAHAVLLMSRPFDLDEYVQLWLDLSDAWADQVVALGGRRPERFVGVWCESVSTEGLGAYLAKVGDAAAGCRRHQMGSELTRSDLKRGREGRGGRGRTVWELMSDVVELGDADALRLWHEYEDVTHGKRAVLFSNGLREAVGLGKEKTDEELAEEEVGGEIVAMVSPAVWRAICAVKWVPLVGLVLRAVERCGLDGVLAILSEHLAGTLSVEAGGADGRHELIVFVFAADEPVGVPREEKVGR